MGVHPHGLHLGGVDLKPCGFSIRVQCVGLQLKMLSGARQEGDVVRIIKVFKLWGGSIWCQYCCLWYFSSFSSQWPGETGSQTCCSPASRQTWWEPIRYTIAVDYGTLAPGIHALNETRDLLWDSVVCALLLCNWWTSVQFWFHALRQSHCGHIGASKRIFMIHTFTHDGGRDSIPPVCDANPRLNKRLRPLRHRTTSNTWILWPNDRQYAAAYILSSFISGPHRWLL